ncbi:MAG: NUDIX hydrolase [Hyphomicrobiales bacterium]|nr:NUDIX hydrolase [Hyphomicrobiales bacterium]
MSNLPQPWRVTASRTIIKDKWIDLRADDCLRADGLEIKPYYVLDYPDWVQVIAIDADENLVVIRQYRHGAGRLTLEIPSGCIDASDADPIAAAARELREETGYAAERLTHVGTICNNPANQTNNIFIVLAEGARRVAEQSLDESEEIAVELMPVAQAREIALTGGFDHSAQIASLLIALEKREART